MPHRTKPHVYIAGPYTSPYSIYNMRTALEAADRLLESGLAHPVVPHLTGFWDFAFPKSYKDWLELDLESMRACDAVWRLPGESSGADGEVQVARKLGLPVFDGITELETFCTGWLKRRTES